MYDGTGAATNADPAGGGAVSAPRAVAGKPRIRKPRAASTRADELPFMAALLSALSGLPGVRVWRQNVGTVKLGDGRFFHAGPPRGAADIAGIVAPGGWFLAIETKGSHTRTTREQIAYAEMIGAAGGIYLRLNAKDGLEEAIAAVRVVIEGRRERFALACAAASAALLR